MRDEGNKRDYQKLFFIWIIILSTKLVTNKFKPKHGIIYKTYLKEKKLSKMFVSSNNNNNSNGHSFKSLYALILFSYVIPFKRETCNMIIYFWIDF